MSDKFKDLLKEQESLMKNIRVTTENIAVLTIRKHELQDKLRKIKLEIEAERAKK